MPGEMISSGHLQSEDSLAAGNLVAVIAHMYGCKAIDAATVYSLLEYLQARYASSNLQQDFASHAYMVTKIARSLQGPGCDVLAHPKETPSEEY